MNEVILVGEVVEITDTEILIKTIKKVSDTENVTDCIAVPINFWMQEREICKGIKKGTKIGITGRLRLSNTVAAEKVTILEEEK